MISELKKNIHLVSLVENASIKLTKRGSEHVGLCPFHIEKTPSFFVYDNRFKCFGCGERGDAIDFVQKLYDLSFKDALKHLGIERGEITPAVIRDIERRKHRAEMMKRFREWERLYCDYVSRLWRKTRKLMLMIPPEDLDLYAKLFHMLPIWEYHRNILIHGSDQEKFELFKEAHNDKLRPRQ